MRWAVNILEKLLFAHQLCFIKKFNKKILKQADNIITSRFDALLLYKGNFFLAALDPKVIFSINFHQWEKNYSTETYQPASIWFRPLHLFQSNKKERQNTVYLYYFVGGK